MHDRNSICLNEGFSRKEPRHWGVRLALKFVSIASATLLCFGENIAAAQPSQNNQKAMDVFLEQQRAQLPKRVDKALPVLLTNLQRVGSDVVMTYERDPQGITAEQFRQSMSSPEAREFVRVDLCGFPAARQWMGMGFALVQLAIERDRGRTSEISRVRVTRADCQ
jgi:hypothetical protein